MSIIGRNEFDAPICEKHGFKGWDCPQCRFERQEQMRWEAEEWYCVNKFLNKLSVPKESPDGQPYSTVGRIAELMRMTESHNYPIRNISDNDFVTYAIQKSTSK